MKRYHHTIKSGIVQDVLACLGHNPFSQSYIGGGISLQFTLPAEYHRTTSDIDVTSSQFMNPAGFRASVEERFHDLSQRGYSLLIRKSHQTMDAHVERDDDHLIVQIPRRSMRKFEERKGILEKEVEHARVVPYQGMDFRLISYEDLIAHKLVRSTTFVREYGLVLPEYDLDTLKEKLNGAKEDFEISQFSVTPKEAARLLAQIRLNADIFDIKAVTRYFGNELDERYMNESLSWYRERTDSVAVKGWRNLLDHIAA